jgi:hypothetical protein
VIPLKESKKGSLCPCCSLYTSEGKLSAKSSKIFKIKSEVLGPKANAFPNRHRLGRLKMGGSQTGKFSVLKSLSPKKVEGGHQILLEKGQALSINPQVRIICDKTGGCSQVKNPLC